MRQASSSYEALDAKLQVEAKGVKKRAPNMSLKYAQSALKRTENRSYLNDSVDVMA